MSPFFYLKNLNIFLYDNIGEKKHSAKTIDLERTSQAHRINLINKLLNPTRLMLEEIDRKIFMRRNQRK